MVGDQAQRLDSHRITRGAAQGGQGQGNAQRQAEALAPVAQARKDEARINGGRDNDGCQGHDNGLDAQVPDLIGARIRKGRPLHQRPFVIAVGKKEQNTVSHSEHKAGQQSPH